MFEKILIANRGEIACRIIRTCRRLGIRTVAVYSDADAGAQHARLADVAVHIGGSSPRESYLRPEAILEAARATGSRIEIVRDAREAVTGADLVVTDTWVSMGQDHAHNKVAAMAPFQVDERLMAGAKGDAIFLHCLPAHRGDEVVDAVIDGPQSRVWDEAENRVHAQKSILLWALGKL